MQITTAEEYLQAVIKNRQLNEQLAELANRESEEIEQVCIKYKKLDHQIRTEINELADILCQFERQQLDKTINRHN